MPVTFLAVNNLSKSFGVESIFSDVSFQVREQERIALVGVNGAGKSTLLNILAGHETADSGSIDYRDGLRVTYQAQEASFPPEQTVWEAGLAAFAETLHLRDRMAELELAMASAGDEALDHLFDEYAELSTRFETAGGYDIDHQVASVLDGLGFSEDDRTLSTSNLSGGQRTRLALAQALLSDPDLLLLDEPTNHLDLKALDWIDGFLRSWRRALIVVSHDRYFLDRVTERTLDLSFGTLEDYPGGYSRYVELRTERRARQQIEYEAQQEFINRTEEFIRRYKAGQRSKEARGRETRLARLERIEAPREHQVLKVRLQTAARSGRAVLTTTPLVVGYPGESSQSEPAVLARTPEMEVERGDRVAVIGPNGAGKTTLVRTIIGELPPLKGRMQFGVNVKPAYYAQGHEQLDPEDTVLSTLLKKRAWGEEAARTVAGRYLFSGDDVYKPVDALSGGERSRLALALLALEEANFLILDEPTNHLDISSREALEIVLSEFDGTILFVSHDRYLIDRLATHLWVLEDGAVTPRLGNYSDYLRSRSNEPEPKGKAGQATKAAAQPKTPRPVPARDTQSNGRRSDRELRKLRQELAAAERSIGKLEQRLNEISDDLAVANVDQNIDAIARLGQEYDEVQQRLEESYREWETLSASLYEADAEDERAGASVHD